MTVSGAYDFAGLETVADIRRLLEVAALDTLGLENSIARARALTYLATAAIKLLEVGELEQRLASLEAAVHGQSLPESAFDAEPQSTDEVTLVEWDPEAEDKIAAAALYAHTDLTDAQLQAVVKEMSDDDKASVIRAYVGNLRDPHAAITMDEVGQHIDDTYFAWIGSAEDDSVFYYRIHSPVILIEFDHQNPVGTTQINTPGTPTRDHIHTVVRTPNGNDYGKDLLAQHLAAQPH